MSEMLHRIEALLKEWAQECMAEGRAQALDRNTGLERSPAQMARLVVEAMCEPTEAMLKAGELQLLVDGPPDSEPDADEERADMAWRAMVDAALGEKS